MQDKPDKHPTRDARGRLPEINRTDTGSKMPSILSIPRITRRAGKVWHRNLDVFIKTWKVNFFPPLIEAFLYLSAIGLGIGTYVGTINGVAYINFIAPAHPCNLGHELCVL